jgi:hypothetical protein
LATFDWAVSLQSRPNRVKVAKVAKVANFLVIPPGALLPLRRRRFVAIPSWPRPK